MTLIAASASWGASPPMLAVSVRGDNAIEFYNLAGTGVYPSFAEKIPVGKNPGELCLAPDSKRLYVGLTGDKKVAVVDLENKSVVATFGDPALQSPDGCAVSPDSRKLYLVDQAGNAVFVFATDSRSGAKRIEVGKEPRRVVFSPDGKRILVSDAQSNTLTVIDPLTDKIVSTVKTGNEPRDIAFSADGKLLAVSLIADDSAEIFDGQTLAFKQQVGSAWSPQHLAFAPDAQHLYVVGHVRDEIALMRVGRLTRVEWFISVPHGAVGEHQTWGFAMLPDGKYLYVSNIGDGTIGVVDPAATHTIRTITTGKQPYSIAYIPASGGTVGMNAAARAAYYRTLAQKAVAGIKAGDFVGAANLCRTLEQRWDEGESALRQNAQETWNQVDMAMDDFIHPIIRAGGKQPDSTTLDASYQNFLAKLELLQ